MSKARLLISAFIALNLLTVLFINKPYRVDRALDAMLVPYLSRESLRQAQTAGWYLRRYAHLVGLDNRWEMFTVVPRFDWDYVIKARYADSTAVILPLPRQSPRTFWQAHLADFKEAKYHLNMYTSPPGRQSYAYYLCREFPSRGGAPVKSIIFEGWYRRFVTSPSEAKRRGTHYDGEVGTQVLGAFPCPPAGRRP